MLFLVRPLLPYYQDKEVITPNLPFFASFFAEADNNSAKRSSKALTYYSHFQPTTFLTVFALFQSNAKCIAFCLYDKFHYSHYHHLSG